MAKRGKYKSYLGKSKGVKKTKKVVVEKVEKKEPVKKRRTLNSSVSLQNILEGIDMSNAVAFEKHKHFVGEKIVLNRKIDLPDKRENARTAGGVVIGLYPHFLLVDCGNYKTTVSYKDLVLGGKNYG